MAFEKYIKRIVYEVKCDCGYSDILESNPPREKQCPECKKWIKYEESSWLGPELK